MPTYVILTQLNSSRERVLFEKEALNDNFESRYESGINFCISHNFFRIFSLCNIFIYYTKGAFSHDIFNH